jgi:hypothetical protein
MLLQLEASKYSRKHYLQDEHSASTTAGMSGKTAMME